jgi:hypothetical protein
MRMRREGGKGVKVRSMPRPACLEKRNFLIFIPEKKE